jgi:ribosomal protein S1
VTGLLPESKMKKVKLEIKPEDIGTEIELRIANINKETRRISLEPMNMPEREDRKPNTVNRQNTQDRKPNKDKGEFKPRKPKDNTQDEDWKKYASSYQSVPEDNPFNNL